MFSFTETLIDISNQCIPNFSTNSFKKKKPGLMMNVKKLLKTQRQFKSF